MKQIIHILFYCFFTFAFAEGGLEKSKNIHVISIGINKYSGTLHPLNLCVNDANDLVNKIKADNPKRTKEDVQENIQKYGRGVKDGYAIDKVISYILTDEQATLENIRNTFKKVIASASSNDYFVFLFSGYSMESQNGETFIIPYVENIDFEYTLDKNSFQYSKFDKSKVFSLVEMAKLMEQIACKNQLIISEAGSGSAFGQNLMAELFESNPLVAASTERNRIILTTKEMGMENSSNQNGFLMKYILENGNILNAIHQPNQYEFDLMKSELLSPVRSSKYVAIFNEKNYRSVLLKNYNKINTRGSKSKTLEKTKEIEDQKSETFAFILATEDYNDDQESWDNLKNPINDAEAVAKILFERYNVKTTKVYNKDKNEVLKAFLKFKEQLGEKDKLLFFVAGHGYYSEAFSDGYLVMKDSYSLDDDLTLDSYLSMAKLNRILDGVKCKQVFSIFDVCYGASFELNNANLSVENYSNTKMDNGLDIFIQEKDKSMSRIVLASGKYEVYDYWKDSQKHSPFADKLIKALNTEKQFISPGKIFSYVQGNATTPILKQFGKHEARGDFLIKVK
ncbi:caspase family protein [Seonamhaeicola sp. MEBiC1930]|uniref:caspase family protein n=1 Tax=Seonamhaeicola sp. MEBiC01930 TaxID=2976768 RepID=UPI00324F5FD0